VAFGPRYVSFAAPLFEALAIAGNTCVVLTDNIVAFPRCQVVSWTNDETHFSHRKRIPIRAALEAGAETAYWVEADSAFDRPVAGVPVFPALAPGLHSRFAQRTLPTCAGNPSRMREIFMAACDHFQVDPAMVAHPYAAQFAVSKDAAGVWRAFLTALDAYALWLRDFHPPSLGHSVSDRIGTGIAARMVGWTVQPNPGPMIAVATVCRHLWIGDFRQEPDFATR
jgi:hypothetical protein